MFPLCVDIKGLREVRIGQYYLICDGSFDIVKC